MQSSRALVEVKWLPFIPLGLLNAVGKSSSSCRCQQTLLQLLCLRESWLHVIMLFWSGREAAWPVWYQGSGTVCLVFCVSFSFLSLTTYPVIWQDTLMVNTLFLLFFHEKLSKPNKMYVKKSISVPWTSDGSDLICCPPGCLQQKGGNRGKTLMAIHEQKEATWLSWWPPVLLLWMFLP